MHNSTIIGSSQRGNSKDTNEDVSRCKDGKLCDACPGDKPNNAKGVSRRRYRWALKWLSLRGLTLTYNYAWKTYLVCIKHILYHFRYNSENCRALLERYDAPPAIDAVNEEISGDQVCFRQNNIFQYCFIKCAVWISLFNFYNFYIVYGIWQYSQQLE